jgi:hypothetical protein
MAEDPRLRLLSQAIDGVVSQTCCRHYEAATQEPQLTAKIAHAIEHELNGITVNGQHVEVHVQDWDSIGASSREKKVGANLYISIVVKEGDRVIASKGMLVQSKWDSTLQKGRDQLSNQLNEMQERTDASYVWVYQRTGVSVLDANAVAQTPVDMSHATTPGNLITDGIECTKGDPAIGRDPALPPVQGLNAMMERLAVRRGLAFTLHR